MHVSAIKVDPPEQEYPVSTTHAELQPSPPTVFPSSQNAAEGLLYILPSPQVSVQVSATELLPPEQVYPTSVRHNDPQPSPVTEFPSSQ